MAQGYYQYNGMVPVPMAPASGWQPAQHGVLPGGQVVAVMPPPGMVVVPSGAMPPAMMPPPGHQVGSDGAPLALGSAAGTTGIGADMDMVASFLKVPSSNSTEVSSGEGAEDHAGAKRQKISSSEKKKGGPG